MAGKKSKNKFEEFGGEMVVAPLTGFEFKESFSPSESLDGMQERMEERLKKVRKLKKNNIFTNPFTSSED